MDDDSSPPPSPMPPLPKEIASMIATGLSVQDILALCKSNRRMNETVCNNPDFWRALQVRDYGSWNYPILPHDILPMTHATRNDVWLDGTPVYTGDALKWEAPIPVQNYPAVIKATLPGTGNTVQIHDTDYIWYYFMWAPKFHRLVNYNKKYTDEQILKDLQENVPVRAVSVRRQYGQSVFGLAYKRKHLMLLQKGITRIEPGDDNLLEVLQSPQLNTLEQMKSTSGVRRSLFDEFTISGMYPRYVATYHWDCLLKPRTLQDLSLEYDSGPLCSLAFMVSMQTNDMNKRKQLYDALVKKYDIMGQLDKLEKRINSPKIVKGFSSLKNAFSKLLASYENSSPSVNVLPIMDNLWPRYMYEKVQSLYVNTILPAWKKDQIRLKASREAREAARQAGIEARQARRRAERLAEANAERLGGANAERLAEANAEDADLENVVDDADDVDLENVVDEDDDVDLENVVDEADNVDE